MPGLVRAPWGLIALLLLTGIALIRSGTEGTSGPPQPTAESAADGHTDAVLTAPVPSTALPPSADPLPYSRPARVRIPSIGVDAPLVRLGLDEEGWIDSPPPQEKNLAGWFQEAVTPGQRGTAVLVGHGDNASGPLVFHRLGALKKGSEIEVARRDGRTAVFVVYGVEVFDRQAFPARRVYADTGRAEIRVITCGGTFSRSSGYAGNVVAFARMTAVR